MSRRARSPISTPRMPRAERRASILDTSARLFARKGLNGVTTKEIAQACGVTEPVLYQHFSGKEEIYSELQTLCGSQTLIFHRLFRGYPETTETFVLFTFMLVTMITGLRDPGAAPGTRSEISETLTRLMGYSFMEDGKFARTLLEQCIGSVFKYWQGAYEGAHESGDLEVESADPTALWLSYQQIISGALFRLPEPALIPSLADETKRIEKTTLYVLRGLGLKERAIAKHWDLKKLLAFYRTLEKPAG